MKKGLPSALAIATITGFTLACGGTGEGVDLDGGSADNVASCERYVDHMNGLECLDIEYSKEDMCSMLDMSPVDMSSYYDCLVENSSCDGEIPKIDTSSCTMPTL